MFLRGSAPSVCVRDHYGVIPIAAEVCTRMCTNYLAASQRCPFSRARALLAKISLRRRSLPHRPLLSCLETASNPSVNSLKVQNRKSLYSRRLGSSGLSIFSFKFSKVVPSGLG